MEVVTKISIGVAQPGETVELSDSEALSLIRQGFADPVSDSEERKSVHVEPIGAFISGEEDKTSKPKITKLTKKEND